MIVNCINSILLVSLRSVVWWFQMPHMRTFSMASCLVARLSIFISILMQLLMVLDTNVDIYLIQLQ